MQDLYKKCPKQSKAVQCDLSVNFGFILNVTTLIIYITGIFRTVINPGTAQDVAAQFFLSIPYLVTKTSWLVILTLIVTSHSEKI